MPSIDGKTGPHCIDGYQHLKPGGQKIEHRLLYANMSFDATNEHAMDARFAPSPKDFATLAATECQFACGRRVEPLGQRRHGGPKFFGILLGSESADAKNFSPVEQPPAIPNDPLAVGLDRNQSLLDIDQQQPRVGRAHPLGTTGQGLLAAGFFVGRGDGHRRLQYRESMGISVDAP